MIYDYCMSDQYMYILKMYVKCAYYMIIYIYIYTKLSSLFRTMLMGLSIYEFSLRNVALKRSRLFIVPTV